jgi:hypothetical protein
MSALALRCVRVRPPHHPPQPEHPHARMAEPGTQPLHVEAGTIPLVAGTNVYTMPSDTIDVIETQLRTGTGQNQIDTTLERISVATYAQQTNKLIQGRPTQVYVDRGVSRHSDRVASA